MIGLEDDKPIRRDTVETGPAEVDPLIVHTREVIRHAIEAIEKNQEHLNRIRQTLAKVPGAAAPGGRK